MERKEGGREGGRGEGTMKEEQGGGSEWYVYHCLYNHNAHNYIEHAQHIII